MTDLEKELLEQRLEKLENLFNNILNLTAGIERLTIEIKYMRDNFNTFTLDVRESINSIDKRLTDLETKPIKRYDSTITAAITTVVSGIVAAIIALIIK